MPTNNYNSWEQLLKQQADDFRMLPSDKNWKQIHIRSKRKFPSFTAVTIFLTIFFSIRPLGSKHIARQQNTGNDKRIGIGAIQKKMAPVPKG
jgi:hypothetical protein